MKYVLVVLLLAGCVHTAPPPAPEKTDWHALIHDASKAVKCETSKNADDRKECP